MINSINEWANFWRYIIGVDPIPADTQSKTTWIEWSNYQEEPVSEEQHKEWQRNRAFSKGMAIVLGKIHRGPYKGKYLAGIDIDNKLGIEEFLSHFGEVDTLEKLAEKTIVEQHLDDKNKVHVYFIVEKPLKKKSGIKSTIGNPDIPAIEVKSEGSHGIIFCTPSMHKNGFPYQIVGTRKATVLNVKQSEILEDRLNQIYKKYDNSFDENGGLTSIKDLFKGDFVIKEGNNRHEALLRVMESLIQRLRGIYTEDEIRNYAWDWNQKHGKPPLDRKEFDEQWKDAKNFILKNEPRNDDPKIEDKEIEYLRDIKKRYISIFFDQLNRLYITIKINDHIECIPLDSNRFKFLVRKEILEKENKTINDDKIDRIVKSIQAEMIFDENIQRKDLSLRVAGTEDKTFYYDLTNQKWEIVKITSEGWKIVQNNSIPLFKRYENNVKPQVYPKKDDNNEKNFKEFLNLFNLRSEKDRLLLET